MKRALATFALAGLLLSGCAGPKSDYPASTAADLQQRVLAVATASADGDAFTALLRLQELEAAAYAAAARSLISEARLASILSSIALVRSDLEKALSEAELAELQQRLDELEQQQPSAPPSGTDGGSPESGDQNSGGAEVDEQAEKEKAKEAKEQRKEAKEEQKEAAEQARKAAEEQRKAEEDARKAEEEAAEEEADEAEKAQEDAEQDD
jgi:hypothetical protein